MIGVCQTECTKLVCCNYRSNANSGNTTLLLYSDKEKTAGNGVLQNDQ